MKFSIYLNSRVFVKLIFHANFVWGVKAFFSGKIRKYYEMSSAEIFPSILSVFTCIMLFFKWISNKFESSTGSNDRILNQNLWNTRMLHELLETVQKQLTLKAPFKIVTDDILFYYDHYYLFCRKIKKNPWHFIWIVCDAWSSVQTK